ncbi:MAG: hypothetical protein HY652_07045 [Acidobacteria bacterium]|nr:hypothetical protein [Acidobacteriota bacterium]
MTVEEFRHRFRRNPMKRARHAGLLRNVRIALRNLGSSTRQSFSKKACGSQPG